MNISRPRGVSASFMVMQGAFRVGVEDFRAGRPFRSGNDLPPLCAGFDSIGNRERMYEIGRLTAAFARARRRKVSAATMRAAKTAGYIP